MVAKILQQLTSDDFVVSAGSLSTPSSLRRFLQRSPEVAAIKEGLRQEAITENTLRNFVSSLLQDLRRGERFPHQLAVAAIAVALEDRATEFADGFLHDLSRLELAEMSACIRVARDCLKDRVRVTHTRSRSFCLAAGDGSSLSPTRGSTISFRTEVAQSEQRLTCGAS